jgi:hypothetical protein
MKYRIVEVVDGLGRIRYQIEWAKSHKYRILKEAKFGKAGYYEIPIFFNTKEEAINRIDRLIKLAIPEKRKIVYP